MQDKIKINIKTGKEKQIAAGAFFVRISAMNKKHNVSLEEEIDDGDNKNTYYILVLDGIYPIGTCRLNKIDDTSVMISRVAVLPDYRHMGIGTTVLQNAEKLAAKLGYKTLVLESRETKIGFYEKLGYTPDFSKIKYSSSFKCIHMEKEIIPELQNRHIYKTDIGDVCMSETEYEMYKEKKLNKINN